MFKTIYFIGCFIALAIVIYLNQQDWFNFSIDNAVDDAIKQSSLENDIIYADIDDLQKETDSMQAFARVVFTTVVTFLSWIGVFIGISHIIIHIKEKHNND